MKLSNYHKYIVGVAACMKITTKTTEVCGQILSEKNFFSGSCFIIVKTVEDSNVEGVDYFRPVRKIHKVFL